MHEVFILCCIITPRVYSYGGNALEYTVVDVAGILFPPYTFPLEAGQKGGSWNGTELTSRKNLLH